MPLLPWRVDLFGLRFEITQGVAHLGGFLVILPEHGVAQVAFEFLALAQRAIAQDFFAPKLQRLDLWTLVDEFRARVLSVEFPKAIHALIDDFDSGIEIVPQEFLGGLGPGIEHEHLWPKLLQRPSEFLAFGVLGHEVEHLQISLRIASDAWIILELEQANGT